MAGQLVLSLLAPLQLRVLLHIVQAFLAGRTQAHLQAFRRQAAIRGFMSRRYTMGQACCLRVQAALGAAPVNYRKSDLDIFVTHAAAPRLRAGLVSTAEFGLSGWKQGGIR